MKVTVKGLDKLEHKIESITTELELQPILEKACLIVENEAKLKCPVDTGALRNSITHEVRNNEGVVGTNFEYAPYVEYGTGLFASEGNGRKTRWSYQTADGEWHSTLGQKPQPFLGPALKEKRTEVIDIIKQGVLEQWSM